nr:TetR/AcrR family transcriptional regulator [Porphyromonas gingivalis]
MDRSGFKRKKSFQNLANPIFFYNIAFRNRERTFCFNSKVMARTNNKEIILKEAFRLFLSKGYDAVSFADLVKATNISRGGMFHHFKGKEDIFNQVADRFVFNFFREGESFIESPKSATPLKDFLAHCTKIIGERMLHFSETLGASVTAASFMSFILYLKEHYASWQEKIQEYEEQEVKTWNEVIELAKKKREIREDIDNGQIITVFRTLYLGLSYKGALIDRLSIEELQRLWEFIYQEYKL